MSDRTELTQSSPSSRQTLVLAAPPDAIPSDAIAQAAALLRAGEVVAFPTETVYGLGADATSETAVRRIFAAKERPLSDPLIVHLAEAEQLTEVARDIPPIAWRLAERFWPGPLTVVLPLRANAPVAAAVTAGLPTIALRMPAHPLMQAVLREAGVPLAAPSANRSGSVSPTSAEHVLASFGSEAPAVLDGGVCERGLESTIVALREGGWQLLRPGPIAEEAVAAVLGDAMAVSPGGWSAGRRGGRTSSRTGVRRGGAGRGRCQPAPA